MPRHSFPTFISLEFRIYMHPRVFAHAKAVPMAMTLPIPRV